MADDYLVSYAEIRERRAREYQINNVKNWLHNHPLAITYEEQAFIQKEGDLFTLVPRTRSPLQKVLEKWQALGRTGLFRKPQRDDRLFSETTTYHSNARMEFFASGVVIITGLMLLLGPMWALQFVTDNVKRLGIITGFVMLFTMAIYIASAAKPFEVLAATAA